MNNTSSIIDVLSGKQSVKLEVSVNPLSAVYIGVAVFVAVAIGVIIGALISKKV